VTRWFQACEFAMKLFVTIHFNVTMFKDIGKSTGGETGAFAGMAYSIR
jgi:hypothetical protein